MATLFTLTEDEYKRFVKMEVALDLLLEGHEENDALYVSAGLVKSVKKMIEKTEEKDEF